MSDGYTQRFQYQAWAKPVDPPPAPPDPAELLGGWVQPQSLPAALFIAAAFGSHLYPAQPIEPPLALAAEAKTVNSADFWHKDEPFESLQAFATVGAEVWSKSEPHEALLDGPDPGIIPWLPEYPDFAREAPPHPVTVGGQFVIQPTLAPPAVPDVATWWQQASEPVRSVPPLEPAHVGWFATWNPEVSTWDEEGLRVFPPQNEPPDPKPFLHPATEGWYTSGREGTLSNFDPEGLPWLQPIGQPTFPAPPPLEGLSVLPVEEIIPVGALPDFGWWAPTNEPVRVEPPLHPATLGWFTQRIWWKTLPGDVKPVFLPTNLPPPPKPFLHPATEGWFALPVLRTWDSDALRVFPPTNLPPDPERAQHPATRGWFTSGQELPRLADFDWFVQASEPVREPVSLHPSTQGWFSTGRDGSLTNFDPEGLPWYQPASEPLREPSGPVQGQVGFVRVEPVVPAPELAWFAETQQPQFPPPPPLQGESLLPLAETVPPAPDFGWWALTQQPYFPAQPLVAEGEFSWQRPPPTIGATRVRIQVLGPHLIVETTTDLSRFDDTEFTLYFTKT
jgi:hypothetical protein